VVVIKRLFRGRLGKGVEQGGGQAEFVKSRSEWELPLVSEVVEKEKTPRIRKDAPLLVLGVQVKRQQGRRPIVREENDFLAVSNGSL